MQNCKRIISLFLVIGKGIKKEMDDHGTLN